MVYPTFPDRVYLDTSYILRLLQYAKSPNDLRSQRCKLLHDHFLRQGTTLETSLFTFEEMCFVIMFKKDLLEKAKQAGHPNIKVFKTRQPDTYQQHYAQVYSAPRLLVNQLSALSIIITHPRRINPSLNPTRRIVDYAIKIFAKYWQLDSKDVLHIAVARNLRIKTLISCDDDFASVTEIDHFNPCR